MNAFLLGLLECPTTVGTQQTAKGLEPFAARQTEPAADGNVLDAITGLVNTDVAVVAENHLIRFFTVRLKEMMENVADQCVHEIFALT